MDDPIISRDTIRQRGADAFDRGVDVDGHNMNPGAPAIEDWRKGWMERRAAVYERDLVKFCAGEVTPP